MEELYSLISYEGARKLRVGEWRRLMPFPLKTSLPDSPPPRFSTHLHSPLSNSLFSQILYSPYSPLTQIPHPHRFSAHPYCPLSNSLRFSTHPDSPFAYTLHTPQFSTHPHCSHPQILHPPRFPTHHTLYQDIPLIPKVNKAETSRDSSLIYVSFLEGKRQFSHR